MNAEETLELIKLLDDQLIYPKPDLPRYKIKGSHENAKPFKKFKRNKKTGR